MNHKQTLKQWVKTNEKYFLDHPEMLKSLMDNPAFLPRFNQIVSARKRRLERKLAKQGKNTVLSVSRKRRSRFSLPKLPSLSHMSEKLNQASEIIDTIRNFSNTIR